MRLGYVVTDRVGCCADAASGHATAEGEQQGAADTGGYSISAFGERLATSKFNGEPPDQHDGRSQFNDAVNAECDEREAVRCDTRTDSDSCLNHHPGNRDVFDYECLLNCSGPVTGRCFDATNRGHYRDPGEYKRTSSPISLSAGLSGGLI
jgi:hypothetical protein